MRIILVCAAGMSTSLLAKKMQDIARERVLEVTVEAMGISALDDTQWRSVDVVLVGPQMRHQLPVLMAKGGAYHVPVDGIPPRDYALADGQKVLEQAISLADDH